MSRYHKPSHNRRMRRASLLALIQRLAIWISTRDCQNCFGTGLVGGMEYIEPMTVRTYRPKNGERGPGEMRTVGGGYGFVSRTCSSCDGNGCVPVPTKRGQRR